MRSPRHISAALALALLLLPPALSAQAPATSPWQWQTGPVLDPGFSLDEAKVVRVTTLAKDGPGSLREALSAPGPGLVVFEVGGVIDLEQKALKLRSSQLYVAGQTAPEPGITIIRGGVEIAGSQVVLQHLRVRPGDAGLKVKGWQPDGITTLAGASEVWIDHCSATWSIDENISASGGPDRPGHRITISHCLIAEALHESTHPKGGHSKGTLIMDGTQEAAVVGNLYAANVERNPLFKSSTSGVAVNNVMASLGDRALHGSGPVKGELSGPLASIAVVGNLVLQGETSKRSARAIFEGSATGYFKDNEGYDWAGQPLDLLRAKFETLSEPPVWPQGLKPITPAAALWQVTRFVGARPATRDAVDDRIVRTALAGQARIIHSQDEVGGYPQLTPTTQALDVPEKGRAKWLEKLTLQVVYGEAAELLKK